MAMIQEFVRLQADVGLARQEFLLGMLAKRMLGRTRLPDGEGRPVLLLPGFGANEALLKRLNNFLHQNGYESEMFIPGFPQDVSLREFMHSLSVTLSQKVGDLEQRTGKKVSLVGQSAGGLYSREFAWRHPEAIDRVITLGSPTFYPENLHLQNKALAALIERRFGTSSERAFSDSRFVHWGKEHPSIPYVAIYSKIDGAVRAETAAIPESQLNVTDNGALRENIAISSSHFGMVLNPFVILAVADRLGADPLNWQVFEPRDHLPKGLGRLSALAYPSADLAEGKIPSMDLHLRQPGGRSSRERVIRTLKTEHGNIGKLLDTVLDELGSTAAGKKPDYTVIAGILDYLHSYTDGFHHPREDLLFERLGRRLPEVDQVINPLINEHQWLDAEGNKLEQALQRHLKGKRSGQRNQRLDTQCRRYVKKLQAHLQREEKEVFPQTSALLPRDWLAVDKGLAYQSDPLFGLDVQQRYEELADALTGRVEGITATMAMNNVIGLETIASCFDVLGSGLTQLKKQGSEQVSTSLETQKSVFKDSLRKPSLKSLIGLPFNLISSNGRLVKENVQANYGSTKAIASELMDVLKQSRNGS